MSKENLLMVGPYPPREMPVLESSYSLHKYWEAEDKAGFVADCAPVVRGILTNGGLGVSNALVDALPNVEIIACFGAGVDKIDLEHAKAKGIWVTHTPGVLTNDVADIGLGLMLALARRIPQGDVYVREGRWLKAKMGILTTSLAGKTLGILGLGRIGRAVAQRALACEMKIAYHDLKADDGVDFAYYDTPTKLAEAVDFLMVCLSGNPSTVGLVDRAVFDALGPKGLFINIARGSVVDEPNLVAALQDGRIGGAALDVFVDEPKVPAPLLAMDNVVLQPHHASGTHETRAAMGDLVIENLRRYFAGEALATPVFQLP